VIVNPEHRADRRFRPLPGRAPSRAVRPSKAECRTPQGRQGRRPPRSQRAVSRFREAPSLPFPRDPLSAPSSMRNVYRCAFFAARSGHRTSIYGPVNLHLRNAHMKMFWNAGIYSDGQILHCPARTVNLGDVGKRPCSNRAKTFSPKGVTTRNGRWSVTTPSVLGLRSQFRPLV
jgi:hypothetical protein